MNRYNYRAKDSSGNVVTGMVEASSPQHAAKLLRQKGLFVIKVSGGKGFSLDFLTGLSKGVNPSELTNFTRQLATMINAGLPITDALLILRSQSQSKMQSTIAQILADVEEGQSLSAAMSKHPKIFSKSYIALVKSGEVSGVLDEVMTKLSDTLEKQQEFRGRVKGAMIYPIIIIIGMVAVALIMLIFVIPRMTSLYDQFGAELPITTKILVFISESMVNFWPILVVILAFALWGLKGYRATKAGRRKLDTWILSIPLIGELQKQVILTDLTRTISLMVGAGVSILESLHIATEISKNSVITEALEDIAVMVEKGFPLAMAFSKHQDVFPFILSQMVAVGEETGKMDEVMAKVSHVFEVESEQKIKALSAAIEPIILIILGIGVAFLVISVIMPIYNLTTKF
jgi:type IV pilus assembly protein PilC